MINIKTKEQLEAMTTREIAAEAQMILRTEGYDKAKVLLQDYIEVANAKMKEFTKKMNKEFKKSRSAPRINVITDFLRFR